MEAWLRSGAIKRLRPTALHFIEAAGQDPEFAQELPHFVAEIKRVQLRPTSATMR
jgi:hypothetical protein